LDRGAQVARSGEIGRRLLSFAADASQVARFRREAQVLATLNHANIPLIFHGGVLVHLSERGVRA
jgi:hypothetical protein